MALTQRAIDTDLIMKHNELIKQLDAVYMHRLNQLLMQKEFILNNLQMQFMHARDALISETNRTNLDVNESPSTTLSNSSLAHAVPSKNQIGARVKSKARKK